jgi:hypothetical protein
MQTRRVLSTTRWLALGISVLIVTLGSSELWAGQMENATANSKTCTVSNVASSYGLLGSGIIIDNPFGLPEGPVATVGVITFDKQNHWVSHRSANINGQVINGISQADTYTVHPDCTFIFVDEMNNSVQFVGVFVADRDEGWFMATGEGVVVTYTMQRMQSKE